MIIIGGKVTMISAEKHEKDENIFVTRIKVLTGTITLTITFLDHEQNLKKRKYTKIVLGIFRGFRLFRDKQNTNRTNDTNGLGL